MTDPASSSSSFSYQWTYDVFLNFRGEDTRWNFVGNLFNALQRKGIRTFMDDEELKKGDEITPSLFKAIEESRMAITVFSKNYASSTFCLDELVKILECIKGNGRLVWPIFHDAEPSDVRHQKGNYDEALAMHQKNFKANEEKLQNWKQALREAANLSGLHFNPGHEYEHQFIEKIVKEISNKINRTPLHIAKYPIGLKSRVLEINHLLEVGSNDEIIMVGIYGIGGMGKSTITRAVYNSIADQFEGLCFLHDIKQNSSKLGLEHMQERMLSKTLGANIMLEDVNEGVSIIKRRLNKMKILLILDNVDKAEQLEKLAGNCDWFGSDSRIIITTRNKQLLASHGVKRLYEVKGFNDKESLELLRWHAFKEDQVDPRYMGVLNCVVEYVKGLPLALEVMGSNLFGKSIEEWKSAINIYRRIPIAEIHKVLKVSYDDLGEAEQEIFLDIASFFKGKDMKYVKDMVQRSRGFGTSYIIGVLMDKCLINNYYHYTVGMHDLIQDMGREIVRQESPNEPGRRSRLWSCEDIVHVLENNTGTGKINCIIQDNVCEDMKVNWNGKAFKQIKNLKILIFKKAWFSESPKYLPNSLRVLQWPKYPSSYLPTDFHPRNLSILDLQKNFLQSLEQIKKLENLSVLDLRKSQFIEQIPDVSGLPNLTKLRLDFCENLTEIHDSVGYMGKLETLTAFGCVKLRNFPGCIKLPSLLYLNLQCCISLEKFPKELEKMEHLTELDLSQTNTELPFSILNPIGLREFVMAIYGKDAELVTDMLRQKLKCPYAETWKLQKLDQAIDELRFRKKDDILNSYLSISLSIGNISDELLSMYLTWFTNVRYLELSGNNFTVLPSCIKECQFLRELYLNDCNHLREIRGIPPNIIVLEGKNCTSLSSESRSIILPSQKLHERGAKRFLIPGESIPEWFDICSKGPSISFWLRNNFPVISLCFVITPLVNKVYCWRAPSARVIINGKERYDIHNIRNFNEYTSILVDHILWPFVLQRDNLQLRSGWNKVEVYIYMDTYVFGKEDKLIGVKEIGMKVMKGNRREDIHFINPYEKLWKLKLPKKIQIFLWKAHHNVLAVKEDIMDDDLTCPKCGAIGEYIMHTLVACPFAEVIWSMSPLMLRCKSLPQASFSSWWEGLSSSLSYLQDSIGMLEIAGFICWRIWKCRNEKVFNRGSMRVWQVILLVMQQINEFRASLQGTRVLSSASEEKDTNNSKCFALTSWWQTPLDDENRTSFSLVYPSDTISNNQENNNAGDCLSLQAPLDEVNRASVLDLPASNSDTTNHQGLRQQHFTSINLQQIPNISENENVRKVKADDVIVYRRKRRIIH